MWHLSPIGRMDHYGAFAARHTGGTRGPGPGDEGPGGFSFSGGGGGDGPDSFGDTWTLAELQALSNNNSVVNNIVGNVVQGLNKIFGTNWKSPQGAPTNTSLRLEADKYRSRLGFEERPLFDRVLDRLLNQIDPGDPGEQQEFTPGGKKASGAQIVGAAFKAVKEAIDDLKSSGGGGGGPRGGGFTYQGEFYPYPAHVDSDADRRQYRKQIENEVGGSAPNAAAPADKVWSWLNPKQQKRSWNSTVHIKRGGNRYAIKNGVITVEQNNGKWKQIGSIPKPDNKGGNKGNKSNAPSSAQIQGDQILLPNGKKVRNNKKNRKRFGL